MVKKKSWQKIKAGVYFIKKEEKEKKKKKKQKRKLCIKNVVTFHCTNMVTGTNKHE